MVSTTSDLGLLGRKLGAVDYDPGLYVREIAQRCVGGHELYQQRTNIQTLSEDTHSQLKKNVYQNYGQFIETAKEITYLKEHEMYPLSSMIAEQKNLLHQLMEMSIIGDKTTGSDAIQDFEDDEEKAKDDKARIKNEIEEGRRKLYDLLEKVEGCSHVTDVPTRYLLHDGDLVEMDVTENTALHRVHGYLMNDGFMVATWLKDRRGPVRFKYSCLYELDSLAVVNVRDFGGIKCAFKLLVFPDARLFQCANAEAKIIWMEAFEDAKRNRQKQHDEIAIKRNDTLRPREAKSARNKHLSKSRQLKKMPRDSYDESKNPFGDDDEEEEDDDEGTESRHDSNENGDKNLSKSASTESAEVDMLDMELPEWLQELPDDLEVFIAQREFEEAVELIHKAQDFCMTHADSALVREANFRLEAKRKQLVDVLTNELRVDKSIRGGPRAARRAVHLLIRLDRSTLACDLFLQHRDAVLQSALRSGKLEIATVAYVQRQSVTFFNSILESSTEFCKAFQVTANSASKYATFLTWVENELDKFCSERVEKQIFSPSTPLETISTCIEFVRKQACKLRDNGLDVVYLFDSKFRRNVERCICEARDKHVEAVKLRSHEDKWVPINCFNKPGTERFVDELSVVGIPSIRSFIYDDCWVALTRNATSFAISYINLVDSLLKLFNPSTRALVNESLVTVFHSHLRHIEQAVRSDRLKDVDPKFVQKNASFLLDALLSLIEHKYQEKTGTDCPKLGKLRSSYSWLKDGTQKTTSAVKGIATDAKHNVDPNYV